MEKSLTRLVRMSSVLRTRTILSGYNARLQSIKKFCHTHCTSAGDLGLLERHGKTLAKIRDISKLTDFESPMTLLNMVEDNYIDLSGKVAIGLLQSLYRSCVASRDATEMKTEITKNKGYRHILEVLNRDLRLLTTSDAIAALNAFYFFGLSADSLLFQSVLQLIRLSVNNLTLGQIVSLHMLLAKFPSSPLTDALLIAFPIVFEAQLNDKLDRSNILSLTTALRYLCSFNKGRGIDLVVTAIQTHKTYLTSTEAQFILLSFCILQSLSPMYKELLYTVQRVLIRDIHHMKVSTISLALRQISSKVTSGQMEFYNETLIDALANAAIAKNINFGEATYLVRKLNQMSYAHIPLLDYVAAKCFENSSSLNINAWLAICDITEGLITADYKPAFWDIISNLVAQNQYHKEIGIIKLTKFAIHLAALDHFSDKIIATIFKENLMNMNLDKRTFLAEQILFLYQSVKTLYPDYSGPWPTNDTLKLGEVTDNSFHKYSIQSGLEHALGGTQYVHNNIRTKLGQTIDHIVVMRRGGYPVAINKLGDNENNAVYIDSIESPPGSQMILIFNLPQEAYSINSQRLKSTWSLKLRIVEAFTGCSTVVINSCLWESLPDREKIPYLMQALRLKCEDTFVDEGNKYMS